ncbi:MAG: hypothetical protein JST10_11860 [Bacteroidetes bacterium]|nr:hypothetical protein [Bacteroidota bacterium]
MNIIKKTGIVTLITFSVYILSGCAPGSYVSANIQYTNPGWAPAYYPGVRYYYLPDIEAYYDLSDQDFVYLDNGQWLFSPTLPPIYSSFNLNNCFVVALNARVYHPWLHHQYYVSHYPRYYYQNIYHGNVAAIRGFNENVKKPIYWKQENLMKTNRLTKDQASKQEKHSFPANESIHSRSDEMKNEQNTGKKVISQKPPQHTNYYGRKIGQPVKVRPQMREMKPVEKGHADA